MREFEKHDVNDRVRGTLGTHRGEHWLATDDLILNEAWLKCSTDPEIELEKIGIDVRQGVIYLSGSVRSRTARELLERTVRSVSGVEDVITAVTLEDEAD